MELSNGVPLQVNKAFALAISAVISDDVQVKRHGGDVPNSAKKFFVTCGNPQCVLYKDYCSPNQNKLLIMLCLEYERKKCQRYLILHVLCTPVRLT